MEENTCSWDTVRNIWILESKDTCTYDGDFHLTEYLALKWDTVSGQWLNDGKLTYSYDADGRPVEYINYYWDETTSQWMNSFRMEYIYDADDNPSTELLYEWDEEKDQWVYNQRRTHYYPGHINADRMLPGADTDILLYPNPVMETVTIKTGLPGPFRVQLLDVAGKLILEKSFQGEGCNLNLGGLQPSVYFIRLTFSGQQSVILKLVKK